MPLTFPTIHLNGTSADSLLHGYREAHQMIGRAMTALGESAPNGRDYYVQDPAAISSAIREHNARIAKLKEVQDELYAIWENVAEQQDAREATKAGRVR